jgi:rhodanese-related sulfurtransferase
MTVTADITMEGLLKEYPGAQRALFRRYHIGGCASCGFRPDETVAEVCARNDNLDPAEVLETVRIAHEQDEAMQIAPTDLKALLPEVDVLDIRTKEEFDAVHIPHSRHFDQTLMQEIMGTWDKDRHLIIVDHTGARSLDAAAYFAGHGFMNIKCLKGGIDGYSQQADPSLPRYTLE